MFWNVEPLKGLGPLRLGMTADEVASILDPIHPITDRSTAFDGSVAEHRGLEVPACSYDGEVLRGIDTNSHLKGLMFNHIDIYQTEARDAMI